MELKQHRLYVANLGGGIVKFGVSGNVAKRVRHFRAKAEHIVWWASAPTTKADAFRCERVMKFIFARKAIQPHREWLDAKFPSVLALAIRVRESRDPTPQALRAQEIFGTLRGRAK